MELFKREKGRLTLKAEGKELLSGYTAALDALQNASLELQMRGQDRSLVIQCDLVDAVGHVDCLRMGIELALACRGNQGFGRFQVVVDQCLPVLLGDGLGILCRVARG